MRFAELLLDRARQTGCEVELWNDGGRHSWNLFEISSGDRGVVLYAKESNSNPGFWGISPNQLKRISTRPFLILFLNNTDEVAYIATPKDLDSRVGRLWKQASDGDFKIHENARILGIARLDFCEAADFMCQLVGGHSSGDAEREYAALTAGNLGVEGIAEFLARLPGSRKQVVRVGKTKARTLDIIAGLIASAGAIGDDPLTLMTSLVPVVANYIEILSDDEALVIRILAEFSPTGPYVNQDLLITELDSRRQQRGLSVRSRIDHERLLESLQQKGCIATSLSPMKKWRLTELVI